MLHERCVHIIDDEAKVRDSLTLLLSTAQIESRSYESAEDYMTSNALKDPACLLLDNQLPGMSGIELLRRIVASWTEITGQSPKHVVAGLNEIDSDTTMEYGLILPKPGDEEQWFTLNADALDGISGTGL